MPEAGMRELKTRASPRSSATSASENAAPAEPAWDELVRLGQEMGRRWRSPLTSAEELSEMRR